jgi:hypothetical protein
MPFLMLKLFPTKYKSLFAFFPSSLAYISLLKQSFDAVVHALVCVLANDVNKMALLIEWALTKDVHNAESTDALFGDACTSTALARAYFPIIGGAHLASGVGSMVLDICTKPDVYKV